MNKTNEKELREIMQFASLSPKRVFTIFLALTERIECLDMSSMDKTQYIAMLEQILDIKKVPDWR